MKFIRLLKIIHVIAKFHLDDLVAGLPKTAAPRILIKLIPSYWLFYFGSNRFEINERCKLALIELGPIFIKLGQLLATRRDLLDDELADELETLTENVPPFATEVVKQIIEDELKKDLTEVFSHFDDQPLAAASIAQVHTAKLKDGEDIVIKVLRPQIEKTINQDIALMESFAKTIEKWLPETRLLFLQDLVQNYKNVILGEINLNREAANTIKFKKNAEKHNYLYIPKVYLDYSTRRIMVSERIYGIPVNQAEKIEAQGTDLKKLAENGVKIFFTQVFRDNFFHADMHPGNIYVNTAYPTANQYASVDCAIAGSLSREDQLFIAQQVVALVQKNYLKNAQLFIDAGWVAKDINKEELALNLQRIAEPIFDKPMSDIDFAPILLELFTTAREFHIKVNPNFLLFQKTLIHIEGLGKQLYPDLNVWEIGKPLLEEWVRELAGPKAVIQALQENAPQFVQQLPELPSLIYLALNRLVQNQDYDKQSADIERIIAEIQERNNKKNRNLLLASLFIGGAYFSQQNTSLNLNDYSANTLILAGIGLSLLFLNLLKP